jgi:hypothetical protein
MYTSRCSGFGMERIGDIDPGAYFSELRHLGDEGERQAGSSGTLSTDHLGNGAYGEPALQDFVN